MADTRCVGPAVGIPACLFVVANVDGRNNKRREVVVQHMDHIGMIVRESGQEVGPVDTVGVVGECIRDHPIGGE
jgi:hypothetical protein